MGIKILIVVNCHRLLDRTEIVKKFINEFNNSVHFSVKAFKKVVAILIDYSYLKFEDNKESFDSLYFPCSDTK